MSIELLRKALGSYQTNCYLLIDPESNEAILIDAPAEADSLLKWASPFTIRQIVLTHGHADHTGALERVRRVLGIPLGAHPADLVDFDLTADKLLQDGDTIALGDAALEVVHIPGHTQGSIALKVLDREGFQFAVVGDAIFPGGPGHTTSHQALRQSLEALEETVFTWPDDVVLHPGHGDSTTVGEERGAFEAFRKKPLSPELYGDVLWR